MGSAILTPDQRLRVFVSSTLGELAQEREAARRAVARLALVPVMFELGARPHPPRELYLAYLRQSHVFVGVYGESYGWVAPDMTVSGIEDELEHADRLPRLIYVKHPAPGRDPRLVALLERLGTQGEVSYQRFGTPEELEQLLAQDLAVLVTERFAGAAEPGEWDARVRPLPVPTSDFVGRVREAAELSARLSEGSDRLVTLTGPGGIGKTRLALHVAALLRDRFADGVAFVPLAGRSPEDLLPAVLVATGAHDVGQAPLGELLAAHLAERELLLVLDNFEHLVGVADVLVRLLEETARLRVLVTSRTALRVHGEVELPVPPLGLPDQGADLEAVRKAEAVELFVHRLAAVRRGFVLDEDRARAVASVCRRLDGLPLALELVAARGNVLTVQEIAARLGSVLDLPARGADVPERQRTLRRTLDWSYDQLDSVAKGVLAQLAVFAGTFTVAAAEAVVEVEPPGDVVEVLATLVDHSLVCSDVTNGHARFWLLETVREYARGRLTDDQAEAAAVRHAAFYRDVAVAAYTSLRGSGQRAALARFDRDAVDVHAATDWFTAQGQWDDVADITWSMWLYDWLRGGLTGCRRTTSRALAEATGLSRVRYGRLLASDGFGATWQRQYDVAVPELMQARAIAAEEGDDELATLANIMLIVVFGGAGDVERARECGQEGLRLARAAGDAWSEAMVLDGLCWVSVGVGRLDEDAELFAPMMAASRAVDDPLCVAMATENMAELRMHQGRFGEAVRLTRESLLMFRELDMVYPAWSSLALSALALSRSGRKETAVRIQAAADAAMRALDVEPWPPLAARQEAMAAEIRASLSPRAYARAAEEGGRWDFRTAVDAAVQALEVLEETVPGSPLTTVPPLRTAVDVAVEADDEIAAMPEEELLAGIERLRSERNAVVLAHNYQVPAIQDLADVVGDSLQLAQAAAASDAEVIAFCGVHFMAETAAITCPDKVVLIPDPEAGCSLAASITADDVRAWRAEHPGGVVVAYVNTDADVKAEVDYCCTSSNAVEVVASIPDGKEILFVPDQFLGLYVKRLTGRDLQLWLGECHVHASFRPEDVDRLMAQHPGADLLLHPECGCVSQCLWRLGEGELPADRTYVLSTGGMVRHARDCPAPVDLVGTEVGMLHRLRAANPAKQFVPLREDAVCSYMKTITVAKLYRSLRDLVHVVTVPEDVAERARRATERMLAVAPTR